MKTLEHRVEYPECLLGPFIVNTDIALRRLESEMQKFREEAEKDRKVFQDKMPEFKRRQEEKNIRKNKEWSALAKKMGTIVEDFIAPALGSTLSKYFQCEVTMEGQRIFRRKNVEDYEIDAIAGCEDKIFMIEACSTPRVEDVKKIKDKSKRFFEFFPEHTGNELMDILNFDKVKSK